MYLLESTNAFCSRTGWINLDIILRYAHLHYQLCNILPVAFMVNFLILWISTLVVCTTYFINKFQVQWIVWECYPQLLLYKEYTKQTPTCNYKLFQTYSCNICHYFKMISMAVVILSVWCSVNSCYPHSRYPEGWLKH